MAGAAKVVLIAVDGNADNVAITLHGVRALTQFARPAASWALLNKVAAGATYLVTLHAPQSLSRVATHGPLAGDITIVEACVECLAVITEHARTLLGLCTRGCAC